MMISQESGWVLSSFPDGAWDTNNPKIWWSAQLPLPSLEYNMILKVVQPLLYAGGGLPNHLTSLMFNI